MRREGRRRTLKALRGGVPKTLRGGVPGARGRRGIPVRHALRGVAGLEQAAHEAAEARAWRAAGGQRGQQHVRARGRRGAARGAAQAAAQCRRGLERQPAACARGARCHVAGA